METDLGAEVANASDRHGAVTPVASARVSKKPCTPRVTKPLVVQASRGSLQGNAENPVLSGEPSLVELGQLMQRQHRELLQRLDSWMKRHDAFMDRCSAAPPDLVAYQNGAPNGFAVGGAPNGQPLPTARASIASSSMGSEGSIQQAARSHKKPPKPVISMWVADYSQRMSEVDTHRKSGAAEKARKTMKKRDTFSTEGSFDRQYPQTCRGYCLLVVESVFFEAFFALAIVSSSAFLGLQVEHSAAHLTTVTPQEYEFINYIYSLLFALELVLRLIAKGCSVMWADEDKFWYWLDVLIVASSFVESGTAIMQMSNSGNEDGAAKNLATLRVARILRVTRLIRVFRIVRIIRFVRALRTLVHSILHTLKALMWAMLLLFLVIYVFSILFTQVSVDYMITEDSGTHRDAIESHWGSLPASMFTLFTCITSGISWDVAASPLGEVSGFYIIFFLVYFIFAYFAVLNVMTGVFCQSAIESAQKDQEMLIQMQLQNKEQYCQRVQALFKKIDDDRSGEITIHELEENLYDVNVKALFDTMDLEISDVWTLFSLLDVDRSGIIDIEEFVDGCVRLRGPAKGIDMAKLSYDSKWIRHRLTAFMRYMETHTQAMHAVFFEDDTDYGYRYSKDLATSSQTWARPSIPTHLGQRMSEFNHSGSQESTDVITAAASENSRLSPVQE